MTETKPLILHYIGTSFDLCTGRNNLMQISCFDSVGAGARCCKEAESMPLCRLNLCLGGSGSHLPAAWL